MTEHHYTARCTWTGAGETGTSDYEAYARSHTVEFPGKPSLTGSADPAFRGDGAVHNPEDLLLASISACHMLWYLHLCAVRGVIVREYIDDATAMMVEAPRNGRFTKAVLHPRIVISKDSDVETAHALHERAHAECFIANSLNFPVLIEPTIHQA